MPRAQKLNVYRTPIGFHDAYIAASSQKAALQAWGTRTNLFAHKAAELVTDPELTREPLAHPGQVIRKLRGSPAEQIAALPPDTRRSPADAARQSSADSRPDRPHEAARGEAPFSGRRPPPPPVRPSRADLGRAERAIATADARHQKALGALRDAEAALAERRRVLDEQHAKRLRALEVKCQEARTRYEEALECWRTANAVRETKV